MLAQQKAADTAAAGSAFLAGTTWVVDITPVLQIAATFVAVIAGGAAAWYHIERAINLRRKRREDDANDN